MYSRQGEWKQPWYRDSSVVPKFLERKKIPSRMDAVSGRQVSTPSSGCQRPQSKAAKVPDQLQLLPAPSSEWDSSGWRAVSPKLGASLTSYHLVLILPVSWTDNFTTKNTQRSTGLSVSFCTKSTFVTQVVCSDHSPAEATCST